MEIMQAFSISYSILLLHWTLLVGSLYDMQFNGLNVNQCWETTFNANTESQSNQPTAKIPTTYKRESFNS